MGGNGSKWNADPETGDSNGEQRCVFFIFFVDGFVDDSSNEVFSKWLRIVFVAFYTEMLHKHAFIYSAF